MIPLARRAVKVNARGTNFNEHLNGDNLFIMQ